MTLITPGARRPGEVGSTLLSSLTALSVLAVGALGAMSTLLSSDTLRRTTTEERAALLAATSVLDEIRATPFADLEATYHGQVRDLATLTPTAPPGTASISVTEDATGNSRWPVYTVVVDVEVEGAVATRSLSFATQVSNLAPEGAPR